MPIAASPARQTVLVTGASSGIGDALSRRFAEAGHPLVLVARNRARLEALATELQCAYRVRAEVIDADLSRAGTAEVLAEQLRAKRRPVEILVNNAGVLSQGRFVAQDAAVHQGMVDLNVGALTAMLAAFVPAMARRGHGRVLNVASIASFQPVPGLATYAATKAYVLSLTESLSEELRERGVTATALCPGITATGMLDGAASHNRKLRALPDFVVGDAAQVADAGYRACMAGDVVAVPGLVNQAAVLAARGTPRALLRRVSGWLGRSLD